MKFVSISFTLPEWASAGKSILGRVSSTTLVAICDYFSNPRVEMLGVGAGDRKMMTHI